jgi:hypothetical protein
MKNVRNLRDNWAKLHTNISVKIPLQNGPPGKAFPGRACGGEALIGPKA